MNRLEAGPGNDAEEALRTAWALARQVGLEPGEFGQLSMQGCDGVLPVRYPLGIAAAGVLGATGVALATLARARGAAPQGVAVDIGHAAFGLVGFRQVRLEGQPIASPGDGNPLVGIYRCRDGAHLAVHGGFPSLRARTLAVLQVGEATHAAIAAAIGSRSSLELEEALAAAGLCAVVCRSAAQWARCEAGRALAAEPLVEVTRIGEADPVAWTPLRPADGALQGVRVLDCTRILAGPTCGRLLAAAGADVLVPTPARLPNIDSYALETGQGKRFLEVDLDEASGRETGLALAQDCDVLVDSYRLGALERRGLGPLSLAARRRRVGVVYVSVNCYGYTGPWQARPGWELMGQAATGLAVGHGGPAGPQPLWTYPCDYLTGYLGAMGAAVALHRRATEGGSWHVRVSLARTGMYAESFGPRVNRPPSAERSVDPYCVHADTPAGRLRYLPVPLTMQATPLRGGSPARQVSGSASPWLMH